MNSSNHLIRYLPSTRDIKRVCLEIQATWSTAERIRRIVKRRQHWLPPFVGTAELALVPTGRPRYPNY